MDEWIHRGVNERRTSGACLGWRNAPGSEMSIGPGAAPYLGEDSIGPEGCRETLPARKPKNDDSLTHSTGCTWLLFVARVSYTAACPCPRRKRVKR